jgi:hypothetical protein
MSNERAFSIPTLQDLSNDTKNTQMRGVLGPAIELWTFGSPKGLQIPNFSKCWASPPHLAKLGLRHLGPGVNPLEGSPNVKLRKLGPKGREDFLFYFFCPKLPRTYYDFQDMVFGTWDLNFGAWEILGYGFQDMVFKTWDLDFTQGLQNGLRPRAPTSTIDHNMKIKMLYHVIQHYYCFGEHIWKY